jgi:hypothetical protein
MVNLILTKMDDIDELSNNTPDERIRKLKKIEENKKKELERVRNLLKESEFEIITEVEEKSRIPIGQLKSFDINNLLSPEEKEIYKIKHFKIEDSKEDDITDIMPENPTTSLEDMTSDHKPDAKWDASQNPQRNYESSLRNQMTTDIYNSTKNMYSAASDGRSVTRETFYDALNIQYEINQREEAMKEGRYSSTEKLERETNAIKNMVDEILNIYKG